MIYITGTNSDLGKSLIKELTKLNLEFSCIKRNFGNLYINNDDFFIHIAAATPFNSHNIKLKDIYNKNIELTKNIISKNVTEAKKFIYISSINAAELESINKKSIKYYYAKSKLDSEKIFRDSKLNLLSIRLPLILSKRNYGFLNDIKNKIQNNKDLEVYNTHSFYNHFIDIQSIIYFIIKIIMDPIIYYDNHIYNVAAKNDMTLDEILNHIINFYSSKSSKKNIIGKYNNYIPIDISSSIQIGYTPKDTKCILDDWLNQK